VIIAQFSDLGRRLGSACRAFQSHQDAREREEEDGVQDISAGVDPKDIRDLLAEREALQAAYDE
jgi:hypothetical protein